MKHAESNHFSRRRLLRGAAAAGLCRLSGAAGAGGLLAGGLAAGPAQARGLGDNAAMTLLKETVWANLRNAGFGSMGYSIGASVDEFRALAKPEIVSGAAAEALLSEALGHLNLALTPTLDRLRQSAAFLAPQARDDLEEALAIALAESAGRLKSQIKTGAVDARSLPAAKSAMAAVLEIASGIFQATGALLATSGPGGAIGAEALREFLRGELGRGVVASDRDGDGCPDGDATIIDLPDAGGCSPTGFGGLQGLLPFLLHQVGMRDFFDSAFSIRVELVGATTDFGISTHVSLGDIERRLAILHTA